LSDIFNVGQFLLSVWVVVSESAGYILALASLTATEIASFFNGSQRNGLYIFT